MPYKDIEKKREYNRDRLRKKRKHINIVPDEDAPVAPILENVVPDEDAHNICRETIILLSYKVIRLRQTERDFYYWLRLMRKLNTEFEEIASLHRYI